MFSQHTELAKQYYNGRFIYDKRLENVVGPEDFALRDTNFHKNYDDFYHPYFQKYGHENDPLVALNIALTTAVQAVHGHMPLCYCPDAISSGTMAHMAAVKYNHHTSGKLGDVIPKEQHLNEHIKANSSRNIARIEHISSLLPEAQMIRIPAMEAAVGHIAESREISGGMRYQDAHFMGFWNPRIDSCSFMILDDVGVDMPSLERVLEEIDFAQSDKKYPRPLEPTTSMDWNNSRNSILEMARGTYIQLGLHPLRPDAKMDIRFYGEETDSLHKATLLERTKPVVQSILRWAPQGIATEEAARTLVRFINLHKMRIDPAFNAQQEVPLNLGALDSIVANPSLQEIQEFNWLIEQIEPFILQYCAHLIRSEGLPDQYAQAKSEVPITVRHRGTDIVNGQEVMKWQRENIPKAAVEKLWPLTAPNEPDPKLICEKRPPIDGRHKPQRRKHDFAFGPFDADDEAEIWPDRPQDNLDKMSYDLLRVVVAAIETDLSPQDTPGFHGVRFDMKRGMPAINAANMNKVQDLSLLPGVLGAKFKESVGAPNILAAQEIVERLQYRPLKNGGFAPVNVFGTPHVKAINNALKEMRPKFVGPGPSAPNSDFRLAMEMEMLRRNYTDITFQEGWETSEDCARMMLMATKIELGKVDRPAGNNTEMAVLDEGGAYISLFDRYEKLRLELKRLSDDPALIKHVGSRNPEAIEQMGVRHISLTLAKMIEIYDCLLDPKHNDGRFELQQVQHQAEFRKNMNDIQKSKFETVRMICDKWAWLWDEDDLENVHDDYKNAWHAAQGREAQLAGPKPIDDQAIKHDFIS